MHSFTSSDHLIYYSNMQSLWPVALCVCVGQLLYTQGRCLFFVLILIPELARLVSIAVLYLCWKQSPRFLSRVVNNLLLSHCQSPCEDICIKLSFFWRLLNLCSSAGDARLLLQGPFTMDRNLSLPLECILNNKQCHCQHRSDLWLLFPRG